jgi:hypothetical protein
LSQFFFNFYNLIQKLSALYKLTEPFSVFYKLVKILPDFLTVSSHIFHLIQLVKLHYYCIHKRLSSTAYSKPAECKLFHPALFHEESHVRVYLGLQCSVFLSKFPTYMLVGIHRLWSILISSPTRTSMLWSP